MLPWEKPQRKEEEQERGVPCEGRQGWHAPGPRPGRKDARGRREGGKAGFAAMDGLE